MKRKNDDHFSTILEKFKKYEELNRSLSKINKIQKGFRHALYSDKSFVLKINNKKSSVDEVAKLATMVADVKINRAWDKYLFGIICNEDANGNQRTSVVLSNATIIGLSEDSTDISLSLEERLFDKLKEIVEARYGEIIFDESSLSFGKIFLTSKKADRSETVSSVLYRIVEKSNPWKKVIIKAPAGDLQGIIKTNDNDSIIMIPAEEIVRYAMGSEFHKQLRASKITKKMSEKLAELFKPYKYIIRASSVKVGKKDVKKIILPLDSFIAYSSDILRRYAWMRNAQKKIYSITTHNPHYRIFMTSDNKSIVMLPGELLITRGGIEEIDLDDAIKEVDTEIFESFGKGEVVGNFDIGRLYHIPALDITARDFWKETELQLKTFDMAIKLYKNGGHILILPSEIKKILEKTVEKIALSS